MKHALRVFAPLSILALVLTGCSSSDSDSDGDGDTTAGTCREYEAGSTSDSITVEGAFGETNPTATIPTPLTADGVQRTILPPTDGDLTEPGANISAVVTLFNGTSGEAAFSESAVLPVADEEVYEVYAAGVDCVPIGSRIVTTAPASDLFGAAGNETLGISGTDSIVVVTDVVGIDKLPTPEPWTENLPEIDLDADTPTVTLPDTDPPAQLQMKVLKEGDGDVVSENDTVSVDYLGTSWNTGEVFDESYSSAPREFGVKGVVKGFGAALAGQKVGSQLIVSIPPELAYGTDSSAHQLGGQTLVFLIDIKDIVDAE